MKRILLTALVLSLTAVSNPSLAVVTEFDDIALDGAGSNPFIRFDVTGEPQKFIVGFNEYFGFWSGSSYSVQMFKSAPSAALVVDSEGLSMKNELNISEDSGIAKINLEHTGTTQDFGVISLNSVSGLYNGGVGLFTETASFPFYVFNDANSETLAVNEFGVSIGKYQALAALHVYADGFPMTEAQIIVENNVNLGVAPRTLLSLQNPGNTKFALENTDAGVAWAFTNSGLDFRVSRQGSGVVEFLVDNAGNMELSGASYATQHINTSSRRFKNPVGPVDSSSILEKLTQLPISTWVYKNTPDMPHIGPMAEDFLAIFGLGDGSSISTVDTAGIAFAAIQELSEQQVKKDAEFAALRADNEALRSELESIKKMLSQVMGSE